MKYKLILHNSAATSDVDISAGFTFYTFNQAVSCAQAWVATNPGILKAHLWDGEIWRLYG